MSNAKYESQTSEMIRSSMNKLSNDVGTYDDGHDAGPVDRFIDVIVSVFGHRRGGGRIRFGALHGERTERLRDPGGVERGDYLALFVYK